MAIHAAAARPLRIVPVKDLQPIEPDDPIEGSVSAVVHWFDVDLVARF
jgi:hypothetical protein